MSSSRAIPTPVERGGAFCHPQSACRFSQLLERRPAGGVGREPQSPARLPSTRWTTTTQSPWADFVHAGNAGCCGGMALLLGVIGDLRCDRLFLSQRRREIGIRRPSAHNRRKSRVFSCAKDIAVGRGCGVRPRRGVGRMRLMSSLLFKVSPAGPFHLLRGVRRPCRHRIARKLPAVASRCGGGPGRALRAE